MSELGKRWRSIRKRAGLEDLTVHDLRRTVGSWMAMRGAGQYLIGEVLRHTDERSTRVYARISEEAKRMAIEDHAESLLGAAGQIEAGHE